MTVIVGLEHDGKVWIGGDSAGVAGYDLTVRADEKVFINRNMIFGFTSSFRMGQLLRYAFTASPQNVDQLDDQYMATTFVNDVRRCLKDGGYAKKKDETEIGGQFLVGYKGLLYKIDADYQVARSAASAITDGRVFSAVGCGAQVALGAMAAMQNSVGPHNQLSMALHAAEAYSAGVRKPFTILSL